VGLPDGVGLDLSRPGKPTDNAHIEASDARLRAERLNASRFLSTSTADARDRIEAWRIDHDGERPHTALWSLTPGAFAAEAHLARGVA
jgi:putative transposase